MTLRHVCLSLLGLAVAPPAWGQAIRHLSADDSVAIIATGPAQVPNQPLGLLIRFYPYGSLEDTARLRRLAHELWHQMQRQVDSAGTSWVVLQATDQTPEPHVGYWKVRNYGFVVQKHTDGKWYLLHDTKPFE